MRSLKALIGKLDDTCRSSLEGAAGLCLSRTNYEVEIEHWLSKLIDVSNSDIPRIAAGLGVDLPRLSKELARAIDRFKTGNSRTPAFSPRLPRLISESWLTASLDFGASRIRSGHLLLALLSNDELASLLKQECKELSVINPDVLRDQFSRAVAGSREESEARGASGDLPAADGSPATTPGAQALDQFTVDLTARAKRGEIDPVTGRDAEVRQMM